MTFCSIYLAQSWMTLQRLWQVSDKGCSAAETLVWMSISRSLIELYSITDWLFGYLNCKVHMLTTNQQSFLWSLSEAAASLSLQSYCATMLSKFLVIAILRRYTCYELLGQKWVLHHQLLHGRLLNCLSTAQPHIFSVVFHATVWFPNSEIISRVPDLACSCGYECT